jgi:hypothetical protein
MRGRHSFAADRAAMVNPEGSKVFHAALEAAAWRIARIRQPSEAGQLDLQSAACAIAAALPDASQRARQRQM